MALQATSSMTAASASSRVGSGHAEMLTDAAADARQSLHQPGEALRLAGLAHLLPFGVITILQPARGIAADRLQMGGGILRVQHSGTRGHRQPCQPAHDRSSSMIGHPAP